MSIIDWFLNSRPARVAILEVKVKDLEESLAASDEMIEKLIKENRKQRELIAALRDVNATLDQRCIDMEKKL